MPEEFVGTLRVSIDRTVDDPLRVTEQEWEEHRKYLKTLNRWITGAALRIDYTEDGINLGSTPVRSGLIHLIKREE